MNHETRLPLPRPFSSAVRTTTFHIPLCAVALCFLLAGSQNRLRGGTRDPVDEVLSERPTANPGMIERVRRLIKENPAHPRILELRYFLTGQLMGASNEPGHFKSLVTQLKDLARDCGKKKQLAFDVEYRIGEIYFNCLHDAGAAYAQYKSMEAHPSLVGDDLETDYRRAQVYLGIANSAYRAPVRRLDEVDKYTRLVLAYPYLGMADRAMYRRFYELYEEAGRLYLTAFQGDLQKLRAVEIYPSHPGLARWRYEALERVLGGRPDQLIPDVLDSPSKRAIEELDEELKAAAPTASASRETPAQRDARGLPEAAPAAGRASPPASAVQRRGLDKAWIWGACVAGSLLLLAAMGAAVIVIRRRHK